jgi:hypothetical protein
MIRANFQGFVASHHEPDFLGLLVREQANIAGSTLLPFSGLSVESEELCAPFNGGAFVSLIYRDRVD